MVNDLIELPLRAILIGDFMPGNGEVVERCATENDVEIICEDGCTFEANQDHILGVEELAISDWKMEDLNI